MAKITVPIKIDGLDYTKNTAVMTDKTFNTSTLTLIFLTFI